MCSEAIQKTAALRDNRLKPVVIEFKGALENIEIVLYPSGLKMSGLPRPLRGLAMTPGVVIASEAIQE